jgi:hypothetical protein
MPRARTGHPALSPRNRAIAARVSRYIARWGSARAAAKAIGVDHVQLWRVASGHFTRTPIATLEALAAHSKRSLDYWTTGRDT